MNPIAPLLHVLIVDDEELIRKHLRYLLKGLQIEAVSEAENGRQALELLLDNERPFPDIIITDMLMSEMDGIEFCNAVRRSELLRNAGVPIIMLTAVTDRLLKDVSKQVGALMIVNKPITGEKLEQVIKACVSDAIGEMV